MHAYRDQYATLFKDGRNVVLIAISTDPVDTLAAWAHDDQFPFLMASDADQTVGRTYGALMSRPGYDTRNLFVVGPDGTVYVSQLGGEAISTFAPASAKRLAMADPIPRAPPVTTAVRFSKEISCASERLLTSGACMALLLWQHSKCPTVH